MEVLLSILYSLVFLGLIFKLKFFATDGISRKAIGLIFLLKVACGLALWYIYTYVYTDRSTADIYKFFDDSKFIYDAFFTAPLDYVKMIYGIGSSSPHFDMYYMQMNHWHREFESGFYNEYQTLIRLNALLCIFSFGYFNVHTVFMCFLSLCGLVGIYKFFVRYLDNKKTELAVIVFLIPSVLFWGSGVLKESLILFVLGMLVYYVGRVEKDIKTTSRYPNAFAIIFFLVLLFFTRLYLFFIVVPALISYRWVYVNSKSAFVKYLLVFGAYFLLVLSFGLLFPKYNILERITTKQHQAIKLASGGAWLMHENKLVYIDPEVTNRITRIGNTGYGQINTGVPYKYIYREHPKDTFSITSSSDTVTYWIFYDQAKAKSYIEISKLEPNLVSLIKTTPRAIVNSLFRPFLSGGSLLIFLPSIENFFIAVFILICILYSSKNSTNRNLVYFCFSIAIPLLILVGLTTPVMGALVRYKVPAMPFLLTGFLIILNKEKLLQSLQVRFIKRKYSENIKQ